MENSKEFKHLVSELQIEGLFVDNNAVALFLRILGSNVRVRVLVRKLIRMQLTHETS